MESYKRLFGKEPLVRAIHAGLECGSLQRKYPNLDMVSFGPTLRGVHSPDERLLIPAVQDGMGSSARRFEEYSCQIIR